jgi:hypothetical protein
MVACSLCWECQESLEKLYGELYVEESTFVVEGTPRGDGVLRDILGFYGEKLLKCFIPILLCPTSKGKEFLRKEDPMETRSLLFNNEQPHS